MLDTWYEKAEDRAGDSESLAKWKCVILDEAWCESCEEDEHWKWVATAPEGEIVNWAETIDAQEQNQDKKINCRVCGCEFWYRGTGYAECPDGHPFRVKKLVPLVTEDW